MAVLIKDTERNANVSVASVNGYSVAKVILAKRYLKEIGQNRRTFPIEKLVEMYNEVKGTKEKAQGCKPCQATKYYNGLQNYAYFGELTLVNNNVCSREDLDLDIIDSRKEEDVIVVNDDVIQEEKPKEDIKERMAKVRAHRKVNKKKDGQD